MMATAGDMQARVALPSVINAEALRDTAPDGRIVFLEGQTMGTLWRLRARAPMALAESGLRDAIVARLMDLVRQMSHWDAASELCHFNALAGGHWASLSPDFATVMRAALVLADHSGGAFSPCMGKLVNAWGFGPTGPVASPPDAAQVAQLLPFCDARRLAMDGARLRQPDGLWLDLSGIAKGYAVDALAQMLRGLGLRHGLIEVGGELAGWGVQGDGQPWWVDLETPPDARLPLLRVALHGLAVATSGTYIKGNHNLDPASGYPASSGVIACSVIHQQAMIADGWASALSVSGPDGGLALAARHHLAVRWVMRDGSEVLSAALHEMIEN